MKAIYGAVSIPKRQTATISVNRSHLDEWFSDLSDNQKLAIFHREAKNAKKETAGRG